ncbi:MAG: Hpt domain-containing protein, partial [Gammaproteobacteria bacterium]
MSPANPESLLIVSEELARTLRDARSAFEVFAEGEEGTVVLENCAGHLHAAGGALQIAETYGASLLAEEMEETCRYIRAQRRRDGPAEEGLDALSRAMVQLPAYIERIVAGGKDVPLVLLPLLNDLRAARACPLMSESTLLLLNVGVSDLAPDAEEYLIKPQPSGEDIAEVSGKIRPQFQLGLLGWIKGDDDSASIAKMATAARHLEQAAAAAEVHQLWWVVGGVLEALQDGGLETGVSLKRLMGQADREIKELHKLGEDQYAQQVPRELINNLLYYVARSKGGGERVDTIRKAFNLSDLAPGDEQVEVLRESLSAPSVKLMKTVANAIREDLAKAKDVLDIYVRTGMDDTEELAPQVGLLRKISDTLGVLGLGSLRESVQ